MTLRFDAAAAPPLELPRLGAARAAQEGRRYPAAAVDALLVAGGDRRAGAAAGAARGRELLLEGRALAVTTGQQPGLFTGPLFTIYKGLTAAALAEVLAEQWGRPLVPVFWVAGDDHDFAEINHCAVLAGDGGLRTITLRERAAGAPMLPAYREIVGEDVGAALGALEAALPPSDFRSETLEWLRGAYAPGRSVAEACAAALAELLGPFGVVVCRGWDASLKGAASDVVTEALRSARTLDAALAAEAARLAAEGTRVQVEVGDGLALAMLEGRDGRDRLRIDGDGFVLRRSGEAVGLPELERIAREEPGRLSANVLLRPVVEARVLPTVAYVGGRAELAYLRQVGPLFTHLAVPRPAAAPRLSGALIEAKVEKALERYRLEPADLAAPEGALASTLARDALPADAAEAVAALRAALAERYAALLAAAMRVERTLERPVETARNQALHGVGEVEKRLVAALKRANEQALQQVARARANLYPDGQPQERVLTVANYLARYGRPLMDELMAAARAHARGLLEA